MPADPTEVTTRLLEGARRSREACSLRANDPVAVVLWRRYRWWIVGAALLALEVLTLHGIGGRGRF